MSLGAGLRGGLMLLLLGAAALAAAQEVKSYEQMKAEMLARPRGSLLTDKAFGASYKPDKTTGRCTGLEQTSDLARKDLGDVAYSASQPAGTDVPFQFATDAHQLTARDELQADEVARLLMDPAFSKRRFSISGHTDADGTRAHNLNLSCARALAVRDALVKRGVAARRMGIYGFGFDRLAVPSDPRHASNRRVEIQNVDDDKP